MCVCVCVCVPHEPRRKIAAVRASRNPVFCDCSTGDFAPHFFRGGHNVTIVLDRSVVI